MASALLQPDILSRAEALGIAARQVVEGLRVGDHKSPFRGFSVEFVQTREYVPGDDIKHIDWKGYGRSERYTVKQYEQETNYVGHILFDASNSMRYGESDTNKLEYAKLLAASVAYAVIKQRDSAALKIFDSKWRGELPASSQMGHMTALCHTLETTIAQDKTDTGKLLEEFADRVARRGLVFVITDAMEEVGPLLKGLQHLRYRGHEVILFHILHQDEFEFPLDGNIRFADLEGPEELLTRPHLLKPAYLRIVKEYLKQLELGCDASRVDYVFMPTNKPLSTALGGYLIKRLQMAKGSRT